MGKLLRKQSYLTKCLKLNQPLNLECMGLKFMTFFFFFSFLPPPLPHLLFHSLLARSSRCWRRGRPQRAICLRRWTRCRAAAASPQGRRRATTLTAKATQRTWPSRKRVGPHLLPHYHTYRRAFILTYSSSRIHSCCTYKTTSDTVTDTGCSSHLYESYYFSLPIHFSVYFLNAINHFYFRCLSSLHLVFIGYNNNRLTSMD